jgi:serine phosphatase RsbU (regulator of sigma subunit)
MRNAAIAQPEWRPTVRARRWRNRVIAVLTILTLVALAAVAGVTYMFYRQAIADLVLERDRQVAFLSAVRLRDEVGRLSEELVSAARARSLRSTDRELQTRALNAAANRLKIFDGGVAFLDTFGRVRVTVPQRPELLNSDWSGRDFFRNLLTTPTPAYYSNAVTIGPQQPSVVVVSVPVQGENNEMVGVLAGMFRLGEPRVSSFYAAIVRLRIGGNGSTYIVDGNGTILYDSSYTRVGQQIDRSMFANKDMQGTALHTRDAAGNNIVLAYAPVPGTDWTLVTEDDWASASRAFTRYAGILLGLLALGMVLSVAGVTLLLRGAHTEQQEQDQGEQETRIMRQIRQRIIPRQLPMLADWDLAVHYRPTRAVGGDFYDCRLLPDGCLMIFLGSVAERGVAAAHLLATARAALRGAADQSLEPGAALEHANRMLCPELSPDVSVACLYGILDPATGELAYANAGFNVPYRVEDDTITEGYEPDPPLGLELGMEYHQNYLTMRPGECAVFYSNGLIAAPNATGKGFGSERLKDVLLRTARDAQAIAAALRSELATFIGEDAQQEEDITLLVLEHRASDKAAAQATALRKRERTGNTPFSPDTEVDL